VRLPLGKIASFIGAQSEFEPGALAEGYSIDSRTVRAGELFFAVRGERLDGHDFVDQALASGAVAAVVAREHVPRFPARNKILVVEDTLTALQSLGAAVRRLWGKPLVAITGSAGKTTTKEAIAHLLATRFHVLKSEGNLNNHFGLPLQLLRLESGHEIAVIEMGMSHSGEIAVLAKIAQPDVGVVTNVAPVHLGFFNSVGDIARAKYELIAGLPAGGTAVLNADDEYVSQFGRDFHGRVVMFGVNHPADVRAEAVETQGTAGSRFQLIVEGCREQVTLPLMGMHNVYNALAAAAVATQRGITPSEAARALATLTPSDKRGQILQLGGATVINDCYNSNPKALDSMVDALAAMPARRRIVVAGEMLELGPAGERLHRESGRHMAEMGIQIVVGVRGLAREIVNAATEAGVESHFLETPESAGEWLTREVRKGDAVLLKASRGVKLERALETWKARLHHVAAG
jgi:UDP-N-acetylmuramoyl-tripeptide--D-alanyl-D-alanine ligase